MLAITLDIRDLTKTYTGPDGAPTPVLDLPELTVPAKAETAIAGPSGTGKTTLFNIIAGLLRPTSGEVRVLDTPIHRLPEAKRDRFRAQHIGYIFQTSNLLAGFSALENVVLAMNFAAALPAAQRGPRARDLLDQVGLADRMHYRPAQLSSGQQQRVALARALANRPALVLADEPTAHVDHATGLRAVALLRSVCAEHGAALLLASHDRALLASCAAVVELQPAAKTRC